MVFREYAEGSIRVTGFRKCRTGAKHLGKLSWNCAAAITHLGSFCCSSASSSSSSFATARILGGGPAGRVPSVPSACSCWLPRGPEASLPPLQLPSSGVGGREGGLEAALSLMLGGLLEKGRGDVEPHSRSPWSLTWPAQRPITNSLHHITNIQRPQSQQDSTSMRMSHSLAACDFRSLQH